MIARLGAYEILFVRDVPSAVVLEQAADLASELSTSRSPDFLSGLLGRLAHVRDTFTEPDDAGGPAPSP